MKAVRFVSPDGDTRIGAAEDGRVRDAGAAGPKGFVPSPEAWAALAAASGPEHDLADVRLLHPVVPDKILAIGVNYRSHADESELDVPAVPVVFAKWTSAISGPDDAVQIPRGSLKTDWEVELGVVIGEGGRYIDEADAMKHVAGYCVVNDVSEREWQLERGTQWDKGKGCDTFGPIGPWLVTADEVPDPQQLDLWLEVDGRRYQNGNTRTMVFGVAQIVSYLSKFMSLQPGDIISTGTPPGVGLGQKPPVYLKPGQTMRLGIAGLGVQTQSTVAA